MLRSRLKPPADLCQRSFSFWPESGVFCGQGPDMVAIFAVTSWHRDDDCAFVSAGEAIDGFAKNQTRSLFEEGD